MALTAGTIIPMAPAPMGDAVAAAWNLPICLANSEEVQPGDVIGINSGVGSDRTGTITTREIVGVALEYYKAPSSATPDDYVMVALAVPGRPFVGNLTGAAGTTDLAAYAHATHGGVLCDLVQCDKNGKAGHGMTVCVIASAADQHARVLQLAREQVKGQSPALAITNPRVYFVFTDTLLVGSLF